MNLTKKNKQTKQTISRTSVMIGSAVGAAAGSLILDPAFIAATAAFGASVANFLEDALTRVLTHTERRRTCDVAQSTMRIIKERVENGDKIRPDFLDEPKKEYDVKIELFEAIIQKAKNSYEERKLPYLAHLYANIVFDSTCSRIEANQIIQLAESLSYSQFCLLEIFSQHGSFNLRNYGYENNALIGITNENNSLLELCMDLYSKRLIGQLQRGTEVDFFESELGGNGFVPSDCKLKPYGFRVHKMLSLSTMQPKEYIPLTKLL